MRRRTVGVLSVTALFVGFVALACDDSRLVACPAGLESFVEFSFYFGLERGDSRQISEEEWDEFLADEVTPHFPDGLTVYDARGQWLDTEASRLYREGTKVLNILVPDEGAASAKRRLDEIADSYVDAFDQQVVFKTSRDACAGF